MIAVLFEAKAAPAHQARYLQLAAELKPLLADIDGFIDSGIRWRKTSELTPT